MGLSDWLRRKLTADPGHRGIPDTSPAARQPAWMRDGMRATEITGADGLRVVAEQDLLWRIVGRQTGGPVQQAIHGLLVAEHDNPRDRNAVAVWVGGHRVGLLDHKDAGKLRPGLIRLQRRFRRAVALPGHVGGDREGLGVFLYYDAHEFGV